MFINYNKTFLRSLITLLLIGAHWNLNAGVLEGNLTIYLKGGKKKLSDFSNGIVYLQGHRTSPPDKPAISRQVNKQFVPRLLPIVQGQSIEFWNHDKVQHNVFCNDDRMTFDLGRYPNDESRQKTFEVPGFYKIYCNIHQRMITDIAVLENKFFSLTDAAGAFRIEGIPPGNYVVVAWHIYGGRTEQPITIIADEVQVLNLTATSTKVLRQLVKHKNKFGKPYITNIFLKWFTTS